MLNTGVDWTKYIIIDRILDKNKLLIHITKWIMKIILICYFKRMNTDKADYIYVTLFPSGES